MPDRAGLFKSLLSEIQSMGEKYLFEMIAEEGLQKGLEKGARNEARKAVLEVLRRRFGKVSRPVAQQLQSIEELPRLKKLVGEAAVTPSLDTFLAFILGRRK
jgi:hypothetical protein